MRVLLVSLIFLVFAAQISAQTGEYKRAELWQKEITAFAEKDEKEFPKPDGVLFIGSSSIRGWQTVQEDFPEIYAINRGFGGSHLEDVNHYAPQIVLPYKPKLIVLYAGENDITAGKLIETIISDFRQFVSVVHSKLPKTRIIFVSLKPSPARWQIRDKFQRVNDLIKAETEKDQRLQFVDVWTQMVNEKGEPQDEIFQADKLHLNAEGYEVWRETLAPHIKKGIKGNFR